MKAMVLAGLAVMLVLASVAPGLAQKAVPTGPDTSLAGALVAARPPTGGIALAVGAAKVKLPKDAIPPDIRPTVTEVAAEYGVLAQRFGGVVAVAPSTMVVLGTPPDTPDPFDGMPPGDILKLLAAGLTPAQWKLLLGQQGLGLSDLPNPKQQALFLALFPGGTLKAQWDRPGEPNRDEDIQDRSAEIPQAHLRLGQNVMLGLPVVGHPEEHTFGMSFAPAGAPKRYVQVGGTESDADYVDGARVRGEVPNAPKRGDLDLTAQTFQVPVPLAGVKTVGQLLSRIGSLCHVELYADARVEGKALTVVGTAGAAPAADLLRAVALCVTGIYRKVGPASVLTDDVPGIGTRRQMWADFERRAADLRQGALDEAGDAVVAQHTMDDVSAQGDPMGLTPQQMATFHKQHAANGAANRSRVISVDLPLDRLTPAQQEVARRTAAYYSRETEGDRPTLDGAITVQSEVALQLVLPSLDGPVDMQYSLLGLFTPSPASLAHQRPPAGTTTHDYQVERDALRRRMEALPLAGLLRGPAHRVVMAEPKTAAEADALVASAKALGLNEVWLEAFSGGQTHTEALTEALKITAGSGFRVFAVIDLLRWGPNAPPDAVDLTLLGKTSAADAQRLDQERDAAAARLGWTGGDSRAQGPRPLIVSVFSPLVRQRLTDTVNTLAALPGLAGLVWRDTAPPGYLPASRVVTPGVPAPLGYALAGRLAFLRRVHSDPIDLYPNEYREGHADTRLPAFDDYALDRSLWDRWGQFRVSENLAFLHTLSSAVTLGQTVLIGARGPADRDLDGPLWYGSWDGAAPPPTDRDEFGAGERWQDAPTQARTQSRTILSPIRIVFWRPTNPGRPLADAFRTETLAGVKMQLSETFKPAAKPLWDGYVLDATVSPLFQRFGTPLPPSGDPLAILVDALGDSGHQ